MGYTTYTEGGDIDERALIGHHLKQAQLTQKPVYVLGIGSEMIEDTKKVTDSLKTLDKVVTAVQHNGTIEVVVTGEKQEVTDVAGEVHAKTRAKVAIVEYAGEDPSTLYVLMRDAIEVTRITGKSWHFYNPDVDSLEAELRNLKPK